MKKILLIGICAVFLFLLEMLFAHPHYSHWWYRMPGFELLYGLAGCCVLIFIAKKLLAPILQRSVDYYDEKSEEGGGVRNDG